MAKWQAFYAGERIAADLDDDQAEQIRADIDAAVRKSRATGAPTWITVRNALGESGEAAVYSVMIDSGVPVWLIGYDAESA